MALLQLVLDIGMKGGGIAGFMTSGGRLGVGVRMGGSGAGHAPGLEAKQRVGTSVTLAGAGQS